MTTTIIPGETAREASKKEAAQPDAFYGYAADAIARARIDESGSLVLNSPEDESLKFVLWYEMAHAGSLVASVKMEGALTSLIYRFSEDGTVERSVAIGDREEIVPNLENLEINAVGALLREAI